MTGPAPEKLPEIFAGIAAGAVARERDRELPHAAVEQLRAAGFGALRVPTAHGGAGLSLPAFFDLLIDLGQADSNLPQLLRGHIAFVEQLLAAPPAAHRDAWLRRIAGGALVGNAQSERGGSPLTAMETRLAQRPDGDWTIHGRKYYSTGSLFADWIYTSGLVDADYATALVPTGSGGVRRDDDWDGFGQRLTGSGTTVFSGAPVAAGDVTVHAGNTLPVSTQQAVLQLVHLATLTGIAQAAREDMLAFVRARRRNGLGGLGELPREDPQIQQVAGEVAGLVFGARAAAREAAAAVHRVQEREREGSAGPEDYRAADSAVFLAQGIVIEQTLRATTDLFRVGGASATSRDRALDRHWRNARTVASHNPEVFRTRAVGAYLLNGTPPALTSLKPRDGRIGDPATPVPASPPDPSR